MGFGLDNGILDLTPEVKATKAKINKYDYLKLKCSTEKGNHGQNEKATCRMGENVCKHCQICLIGG